MIFATLLSAASGEAAERVIKVAAHKYAYDPPAIHVRKNETVVLELTSVDAIHGFNLFAFGVRRDLVPGTTVRVRFIADKLGSFPFACDIFCGSGHEDMSGRLVVTE